MKKALAPIFAFATLLAPSAAWANETITYTYDALGRVSTVNHSGTVNNGIQQQYQHDAADNRSNVTVTGSPFNSSTRVIVVPLGGLTVLTIAP